MATPEQSRIEFDGQTFSVDAALIAESLGIGPALVQPLMREGRITSRCERGIDQDAGRYRLTFFHGHLRALLVVDEEGAIVARSTEADPQQRGLRRSRVRLVP